MNDKTTGHHNLQTAMILFCHGADDFSLWTVDLPAEIIQEVRRSHPIATDGLDALMECIHDLEVCGETRLFFLYGMDAAYSLYVKEGDAAFVEAYRSEGCSVRGSKDTIMAEILDLVQGQTEEEVMR